MNSFLSQAWQWREELGVLKSTQAARIFYGPSEGAKQYKSIAVDFFNHHYWVTHWEEGVPNSQSFYSELIEFYKSKGAKSVVGIYRPKKGTPEEVQVLWGDAPQGRFVVTEGKLKFHIQFEKTRHPGLFLDHAPLRSWLTENCKGKRVLNTFAYTGSLSVACAAGGAKSVTTVDLSQGVIEWAKENMALNGYQGENYLFRVEDVLQYLPRLNREKRKYDCILLDPPSFSHGKKKSFSTSKDLVTLHQAAFDLLEQGGIVMTSINSENVSWSRYQSQVNEAAQSRKMKFVIVKQIDLPETFPTLLEQEQSRYLKGWILKRVV